MKKRPSEIAIETAVELQSAAEERPVKLIAKKDFKISQNEYYREIVAGDDLSDVPAKYRINLRAEGVL